MQKLNEIQFTPELIKQVEACATPEELMQVAKEHDIELSLEEAQTYFAKCVKMELTDEQLDEIEGSFVPYYERTCTNQETSCPIVLHRNKK